MTPSRIYARNIVRDKPADAIYRFLCSLHFRKTHGFWPDFIHPHRFTEKLWSRMLHDRNPQLTLLSDKLGVRSYAESKIGPNYLVPLIWSGDNPDEIPFQQLPARFVIKATHGCSYNIIVTDREKIDPRRITRQLKRWLKENYCNNFLLGIEWGYKHVKPAVIVEEFLDQNGAPPIDYKFYCFSGRVEFLTVHFDRFTEHKTRSFDRNFDPHEFTYHFDQWEGTCERPANFRSMVELAETLAEGFDFMRIDLYSVNDRIYFSEYTPYPGGVSTRFLPVRQDYLLGEKWRLKLGNS